VLRKQGGGAHEKEHESRAQPNIDDVPSPLTKFK
jgi:hypothetical protein